MNAAQPSEVLKMDAMLPISDDSRLDSELEDSFPASDPPSILQPAPRDARDDGVRRNPVWRDQLVGLAILGAALILRRALSRRAAPRGRRR